MAIAPSTFAPQNSAKWRALLQAPPSQDRVKEIEPFNRRDFEVGWGPLDGATFNANNQALEHSFRKTGERGGPYIHEAEGIGS